MIVRKVTGGILGLAIGDALGVPVEFSARETLQRFPVVDMREFGVHHQPRGTWSDDSSMAFCIAESLIEKKEIDLQDIANRFCRWYTESYMTPHGRVFDIGNTTQHVIGRLLRGTPPEKSGDDDENANGNGSLMRTLPLVFILKNEPDIEKRFAAVAAVSAITHAHPRSVIACFYYIEFALQLLDESDKFDIFYKLQTTIGEFLDKKGFTKEKGKFSRLLEGDIHRLPEDSIRSTGYVLHTLEASIWCLLTSNTYAETVLKAVNLGSDTDTTGAVVGGLAGILYGETGIPDEWKAQLVKSEEIWEMGERLFAVFE